MSLAFQRSPDYEPQELGIALAGMKKRRGQQPFQLLLNCSFFWFAGRSPALNDGLWVSIDSGLPIGVTTCGSNRILSRANSVSGILLRLTERVQP